MAIHAYHDVFGSLPPGRILTYDPRYAGPKPPCTSSIVDKSIFVFLLPQVERQALYNAINHDLTMLGAENTTIHAVAVDAYACPSDPDAGRPRDLNADALAPWATDPPGGRLKMVFTSYSACYGSFYVNAIPRPSNGCSPLGPLIAQANGAFNDSSPITMASVSDGLSHTLFASEKAVTNFGGLDALDKSLPLKRGWWTTGNWGDTLMTTFFPINMDKRVSLAAGATRTFAASSLHPGGVNVLMGDGAVRFVSDSIQSWPFDALNGQPIGATQSVGGWWSGLPAPGVWQSLGSRSGGEVVGSGDF